MAYGSFLRSFNRQTHLSILKIQESSISLSHLFFITTYIHNNNILVDKKFIPQSNINRHGQSVGWLFFCVITKGFVGWPKASQSCFNFGQLLKKISQTCFSKFIRRSQFYCADELCRKYNYQYSQLQELSTFAHFNVHCRLFQISSCLIELIEK